MAIRVPVMKILIVYGTTEGANAENCRVDGNLRSRSRAPRRGNGKAKSYVSSAAGAFTFHGSRRLRLDEIGTATRRATAAAGFVPGTSDSLPVCQTICERDSLPVCRIRLEPGPDRLNV